MKKETNNLTTKRFVIRKSLIGKNTVITFVNKKQETVSINFSRHSFLLYLYILFNNSSSNLILIVFNIVYLF